MIDNLKFESYALLMAYDLPSIIQAHSGFLKEPMEQETDLLNEQIHLLLKEMEKYPIDIYSWTPDWDEICRQLKIMLKPLLRISIVDSGSMLLLLKNYHVESEFIDLKTLSERIVFLINKYHHLREFFHSIYNNYKNFKIYHSDIEIGTKKFNEILLKEINKGRTSLSSERTHKEIKGYFNYLKKKTASTYEFILNNLPFDLLTEINTSNDRKVSMFFRKRLAREMKFYLDNTKMLVTQKHYFLGLSFMLDRFIYTKDEFIQKKIEKDKYYEFVPLDYEFFLKDEGYNIYKSL
jgi:hypothetical protein